VFRRVVSCCGALLYASCFIDPTQRQSTDQETRHGGLEDGRIGGREIGEGGCEGIILC
jgi:hypothetical protein